MSRFGGVYTEEMACADQAKAERFRSEAEEWIRANPEAWDYIESQALASAAMGRSFGMKALCEHVRWHVEVAEKAGDLKLNNNHTSSFTRILEERHPEVAPYVRKRHSVHDGTEVL